MHISHGTFNRQIPMSQSSQRRRWTQRAHRMMFALFCVVGTLTLAVSQPVQGQTQLASKGKAVQSIHTAAGASESVKESAQTLATYLKNITGGEFELSADGKADKGIVVGVVSDFPSLKMDQVLTAEGIMGKEQYLLRSHKNGLYVIGQTDIAVRNAVWDLLYRLGHRQFFPGETWEVIPHTPDLSVQVDSLETPDYLYRRIWYGYGPWDYAAEPYQQWGKRNRAQGAFSLNTGHAYDNIIRHNKAEFEAHPEYYALVGGERKGSKMCASNPGLQAVVVKYAKDYFAAEPSRDCVSIDPSDGGNWCECAECAKIGTVSDRALFLANVISKYLEENLPEKYVAMYAYNEHSPPPVKVEARERVIVNVATSFLRGGYTTTELLDAWRAKGVKRLGIREYYSVHPWDRDLPGRARGSNLDYLTRTVPDFHKRGVLFMTSESSDNWGPNGLGYYLSTRMMWDVDQVNHIDALKKDFYDKAFGDASATMQKFYEMIDGSNRPILASPLMGKMYRLLGQARGQSTDEKVLARIDALIQYTRYVELYFNYSQAGSKQRQAAFEAMIRHAYQMRTTMMIHTKALYRDLDRRDKSVSIPKEAGWNVPEAQNPWKISEAFTRAQLDQWVSEGDANYPALAFEPVSFSGDLKLAASVLKLPGVSELPVLNGTKRSRGRMTYNLWADQAPMTWPLKVTGGLIAHYRNRGPTELRMFVGVEDQATLTDSHDVNNDGKEYPVSLKFKDKGLHILSVSDGSDLSEVVFPQNQQPTVEVSEDYSTNFNRASEGYFYVPKGTKVVGGYSSSAGMQVIDAKGQVVLKVGKSGYFHVEVPAEQDGKIWSLKGLSGKLMLMTVPPFVCAKADQLLVPEDVLKKDAGQ